MKGKSKKKKVWLTKKFDKHSFGHPIHPKINQLKKEQDLKKDEENLNARS